MDNVAVGSQPSVSQTRQASHTWDNWILSSSIPSNHMVLERFEILVSVGLQLYSDDDILMAEKESDL
uniref:Uncharacterized protein n=1 Tax=Timema poppense TaxID=170557 RepID=A0A7R9DTC2_TIMPO|nr:unnamed protein product [Timema poppensis]